MVVYNKEDIIRIVKEQDIEFVRLQFTDIFGMLKNVAITASQIEKAVNNQCMFDGSSIEGFVRIDESDQYLYPDLKSFRIFPWRPNHGKVARLICDVYNTDGTPFVGDPRYVLKRVIQKANDMGFDRFNVGPEAEFFLFQTDDEGKPTTKTNDEAGYFDLGPLDHGESTRREICMALEQMEFEIEPPRVRPGPARDRLQVRRGPPCRRQHHDLQAGGQNPGPAQRPPRHLHAQAHLRGGRFRHAHQHVPVQGRQEHVL